MKIDFNEILSFVPDFSTVNAMGTKGEIKGKLLNLNWDGTWKTKLGNFISIDDVEREDVLLTSNIGQICLHNSFVTNSDSSGNLSGQALFISINDLSVTLASVPSFICVVKIDEKSIDRIVFPESIEDSKTGNTSNGLLPFNYGIAKFYLFRIPNNPYLFIQARHPKLKLDSFKSIVNSSLYLFSYLSGVSTSDDFCVVSLGNNEKPKETFIYGGLNKKSTNYTPIAVTWSEFNRAKKELRLPLGQLKDRRPFNPENISKCFTDFINNPDLITPVIYLIASTDAPLEMKGVFLSIALESLTECIVKIKKPISDPIWDKLKIALTKALVDNSLKLDKDTIELFKNKINNLNNPTNQSKLIKPFDIFKISLSKKDKKIIGLRNAYLHTGRVNKPSSKKNKHFKEIYLMEMRYFTLINHLFLKYLGYEGILIDWESRGLDTKQNKYIKI